MGQRRKDSALPFFVAFRQGMDALEFPEVIPAAQTKNHVVTHDQLMRRSRRAARRAKQKRHLFVKERVLRDFA